jgi:Tfp pilus assembly protein PilO
MDLNELKNLNLQDIKAKIIAIADKKTLIKFGISFGSIVVFLIIYYSILNPIVNAKKATLNDMNQKIEETNKFTQEIKGIKNKIKKLTPTYENYSTLFHTRAEVEGLYQTLSEHAGANGLTITKIIKKNVKEVSQADALAKADNKKKKKSKATKKKKTDNIAYYLIPVDFEITGNFLGYIKFKRALSLSRKMLNFDKETIKVVKADTTGAIKVNGTLTIVGLAGENF